jgi:L-asparaginase II
LSEELLHVYRGPIVENIHRGDVAVVDYKGNIVKRVGDAHKFTYFRSAAKPFLALNVILSGAADAFGFDGKELAVMCASHRGEVYHVEAVASILAKTGLDAEILHCGVTEPFSRSAATKLHKNGQALTPLHCNCSGKHLGMLAVCKQQGYPLEGYYDIAHPVQQDELAVLATFTGVEREKIVIGVDGCTVPVHGIPLYNMALAYARLADPSPVGEPYASAVARLTGAIVDNPEMVSGSGAFCTDLMLAGNRRIVGKAGADGVYCVALPHEGLGIALKVEDGDMRSCHIAAANVLKQLGVLDGQQQAQLAKYISAPVTDNYKTKIGEYRAVFSLKA